MRRLEVYPQPADFPCGDKLLRMFGRRGVPADDRVNLLVAVYLLAFVLVESTSQQFDVLCVFGEFDAVFFAAFDDASVLEVDAPLNGRCSVSHGKCHGAQQRQQRETKDSCIHATRHIEVVRKVKHYLDILIRIVV